ncbi:unnamed protein product [Tilletia controversa]|uniref:Uncharacterized protein n=3 Tax=Tilletia TaxID=13289 RepID=A0A8X7MN51_9BASI|nr:hypothetical protein CF336_g5965 [Tilletia laevis]KAE8189267.1 hypothetical protein CF328_g6337 [Tilletia controversa]KAE8256888.1 hypothetical protein A4X03_0g4955 [Tilletia caries]KAE8194436.1 hypothetical protein CF335_g5346 [Tilletia laevis]KAE8242084.1 hypothetical protein A4X06_0g7255 [Tilletia controversa]
MALTLLASLGGVMAAKMTRKPETSTTRLNNAPSPPFPAPCATIAGTLEPNALGTNVLLPPLLTTLSATPPTALPRDFPDPERTTTLPSSPPSMPLPTTTRSITPPALLPPPPTPRSAALPLPTSSPWPGPPVCLRAPEAVVAAAVGATPKVLAHHELPFNRHTLPPPVALRAWHPLPTPPPPVLKLGSVVLMNDDTERS